MADAKKCDRCNSFYSEWENLGLLEEYPDGILGYITVHSCINTTVKNMDLCPHCWRSFFDWLKNLEPKVETDTSTSDIRNS